MLHLALLCKQRGGLWSTPTDMAQFLIAIQKALAGKKTILTKKEARDLLTPCAHNRNYGEGFDVNWNRYGLPVKNGRYFGHTGWNSGYLGFMIGDEQLGNGLVVLINTAPYMTFTGDVVQYKFMTDLIRYVATREHWA